MTEVSGINALAAAPPDDVGAETMARYEFQVMLAATDCLEVLADDDGAVMCEWWEDHVVTKGDTFELVSVKHLEPSAGTWSLAKLVADGGLQHLFQRWKQTHKSGTCRLMTNGGLKTGSDEAAAVAAAANQGVDCARVAALLVDRLGAESVEEVEAFLESLTIRAELPKRDDLRAKLVMDVLPTMCESVGLRSDDAAEVLNVLCQVVREASKSDLRAARRDLATKEDSVALARGIARKTLTREKLKAALGRVVTDRTTALVQKLDRGGLGPTEVEELTRLRSSWLAFESAWDLDLPGQSVVEDCKAAVREVKVQAERDTRRPGEDYGAAMLDRFRSLAEQRASEMGRESITPDLLVGAAMDETDRCRIWWSDRFRLSGAAV